MKVMATVNNAFRLLCLLSVLLLPQFAVSEDLPFTNEALGKIEGTLAYCAQIHSDAAAKYKERSKQFTKDLPEKAVADARKSDEYQKAYKSIKDELGKVPEDQAVQACKAFLEEK